MPASDIQDDSGKLSSEGPAVHLSSTDQKPDTRKRPRRQFSRSKLNFVLDAVLAAAFVLLCAVAAIIQIVFPAPTTAAGWTVFGGTIDQWLILQFGCLCVLAGGVVLHVMLHWSWVCGMLTRGRPDSVLRTDDGVRTIVGVAFLLFLLHVIGLAVLVAMLTVHSP